MTKMGNPWLFRFRPNDPYSGRVIASCTALEYDLGKKNGAIVRIPPTLFGTSGFKAPTAAPTKSVPRS